MTGARTKCLARLCHLSPDLVLVPDLIAPASLTRLAERIKNKALALGFDAVGFCPAQLGPEVRNRLKEFLTQGYHGEMSWLSTRTDERTHPQSLWPEARSVIALGLSYAPEGDPLATLARPDCGNISVYARHRDYHDVVKGMLKHLAQFVVNEGNATLARQEAHNHIPAEVKVFVDTAPVAEKPLAAQAGLGWQGKHTNLVSRQVGSWLFLGEIYTTLVLPTSPPSGGQCGTCTRCLDVCPTKAFPEPYKMDARRCISYLTIEHAGPIPHDLRPAIGTHIYGCDDCLAVCPWNRFAQTSRHIKLQARPELTAPPLKDLLQLDDAAFRRLFAGSPVKRIGRNRFIRNVLIAAGNSHQTMLLHFIHPLLQDPDPVVAEAAHWAITRLKETPA